MIPFCASPVTFVSGLVWGQGQRVGPFVPRALCAALQLMVALSLAAGPETCSPTGWADMVTREVRETGEAEEGKGAVGVYDFLSWWAHLRGFHKSDCRLQNVLKREGWRLCTLNIQMCSVHPETSPIHPLKNWEYPLLSSLLFLKSSLHFHYFAFLIFPFLSSCIHLSHPVPRKKVPSFFILLWVTSCSAEQPGAGGKGDLTHWGVEGRHPAAVCLERAPSI